MTGGPRVGNPLYGVVLYDFNAERADELEAKSGEDIIVIAQSNDEWFVAKPIGRLGGPGLIPVDFVEIRDMVTGQAVEDTQAAIARAGVPKVEEWKKMAAEYKNSSIALGQFEFDDGTARPQLGATNEGNASRNVRSKPTCAPWAGTDHCRHCNPTPPPRTMFSASREGRRRRSCRRPSWHRSTAIILKTPDTGMW